MLGYDLQYVQVLPLVCLVVCTVTEFSSNVAIANIVLPILKEQVAANAQWVLVQEGLPQSLPVRPLYLRVH